MIVRRVERHLANHRGECVRIGAFGIWSDSDYRARVWRLFRGDTRPVPDVSSRLPEIKARSVVSQSRRP
jgi:hypothetical protein